MTTQLCLPIYPEVSSKIIHDDCLHAMQQMEDNSIDFIVTDSPYGISFMSKHWDQQIPPIEYWQEMLRICKPGSMMACAGLPRMYHRLACVVEDAGWLIRDCVMHLFGSGFPKSHNNFGLNGYGTALKPAYEPWLICMKPLEGTFAQNAEKWGVGGINIDESRIPTDDDRSRKNQTEPGFSGGWGTKNTENHKKGRWPANLILDEESAEQLDKMTGVSTSKNVPRNNKKIDDFLIGKKPIQTFGHNDSGGASRFFYCAKASSSERNRGLEGMKWLDNLELVLHNGTSFTLEELWVLEGQNPNMNLDLEASQKRDISEDLMSFLEDKECCIISCGNSISEQFPKTIKFTMLMGLKQIIDLKTWSFYQPLSISDCIQDVLKTNQGNGSNLAENVGLKNILKRIFTKEKMESLLGVKNAVKKMSCLINVKEELKKGNIHPTLKPISLMKYIIKLLAPPGSPVLLDPFAGSGSTLVAAKELGISAIGIEKEQEYVEIAQKRLNREKEDE